jgi:hypothetical protein
MIINGEEYANHYGTLILLFRSVVIHLTCKEEVQYHEQIREVSEVYESLQYIDSSLELHSDSSGVLTAGSLTESYGRLSQVSLLQCTIGGEVNTRNSCFRNSISRFMI